jgi:hypothetical protein
MKQDNDKHANLATEEELNKLIQKGNKLQRTWLFGSIVVIICVLYGDTAQLILAGLIMTYLYIATRSYFKYVSLVNSRSSQ